MVVLNDYSDRLKWSMKQATVTVQQLADHMGLSYQGVKKVVDGKSHAFNAANNEAAAAFLGVTSRWLATGKGPRRLTDPATTENRFKPAVTTPEGVNENQPESVRSAFLHEDRWIAEAIRTLQELPEQDRRAAVLNLRVFVTTLDKPGDGQALPVAA